MSTGSLPEPTSYGVDVYALGQAGPLGSDLWWPWDTSSAFTISLASGLAVKAIWFPFPQGEMSFYAGDTATGTPFYVTPGLVAEMVSIPNDAPIVTITFSGIGTPVVYFYASSVPFTPFSAGTPPEINVGVQEPILNLGTSEAPIIALDTPLAVIYGGSGSAAPSLVAGANVTIIGSWPNQEISVAEGAGGVQSVGVQAPLVLTGSAQNPVIGLDTPLATGFGGTGITDPWIKGGVGIEINGVGGVEDDSFQWNVTNVGVTQINPGDCVGVVALTSADDSVTITNPTGNQVDFSVNFPNQKAFFAHVNNPAPTGSGGGSSTITLPSLPNGTWLIEAFTDGLSAMTSAGSGCQALLSVNLGVGQAGWDATQNQRNIMLAGTVTNPVPAPSATLTWTTGVSVSAYAVGGAFLWLKATRIT
jgi:hypothetical protein